MALAVAWPVLTLLSKKGRKSILRHLVKIRGQVMGSAKKSLILFFFLLVSQGARARPPLSARIGGVFNSVDSTLGAALGQAVAEINNSTALLPDTRLDQLTAYRSLSSFEKNKTGKTIKVAHIVSSASQVSLWKALTQFVDILLTASLPFSLPQSRCPTPP